MSQTLLQAFITFLVTIDPIALAPVFVSLTAETDAPARRRIAVRAAAVAAAVLFVFAVGGEFLLRALGIGLPALRIAGGALLFLLAIEMVFARQSGYRSTTASETEEAAHRHDPAVFPLAVPLISGPAAITAVIVMMGEAGASLLVKGGVLAMLALVLALVLAVLLLAARLVGVLGVTGVNVIGRVLGILLGALAVQFILDGITASGLFAGGPGAA